MIVADTTESTMTLAELLAQGGLTMVPIYACSVLALATFLHKLIELRRARVGDLGWLERALAKIGSGDYAAAELICAEVGHPAAPMVRAQCQALSRRPDQAAAEARRVGSLQLQALESRLSFLAFVAQVAPLLGLLGTVIGMVDLFLGLQGAGAGGGGVAVEELAGGIWKALLTTAAGLSVAVPTLAGHSWLAARIDAVRLQLSDIAQRVLFAAPVDTE